MMEDQDKNYVKVVVICVVVALVGIVCIIGNFLVIRALICSKYPKIPIYIAIGGMAVADLLNIVMEIPNIIIDEVEYKGIMNTSLCKAHFYVTSVCTYVAAAHLVLFSIIRCIMLNDRVHSRSYVRHTFVGCIVIWLVTCFSNILNLKTVAYDGLLNKCIELGSKVLPEDERIMWLRISFSYLIPIFVIFILYVLTKILSMRFFDESYSSRERRFSRMVTLLIVTYAIFKLPNDVVVVLLFYKSREFMQYDFLDPASDVIYDQIITLFEIQRYCHSIALIDLGLRPIIYAKFSYYFGNSFDEVINCDSCREKNHRPRRRKTDSGMSTLTTQTTDGGDEIIVEREEYIENAPADDSNEYVTDSLVEEETKSPIHVSIFINEDKNGMYIGSICDEKNGMLMGVKLEPENGENGENVVEND